MDDLVPQVEAKFLRPERRLDHAGAGDQPRHRAEARFYGFGGRVDRQSVADVDGDEVAADIGGHLLAGGVIDVGDDDMEPAGGEYRTTGRADAAGAPGDDHDGAAHGRPPVIEGRCLVPHAGGLDSKSCNGSSRSQFLEY